LASCGDCRAAQARYRPVAPEAENAEARRPFGHRASTATGSHRASHTCQAGVCSPWARPSRQLTARLVAWGADCSLLVVEEPESVVRQAGAAARPSHRQSATSTTGRSGGSSIRSVISGRSAFRSEPGRRPSEASGYAAVAKTDARSSATPTGRQPTDPLRPARARRFPNGVTPDRTRAVSAMRMRTG
jgi:hypothetical protein